MKALLASITPQILDLMTPVLLAALGWLSWRAAGWIKAHTKNAQVQGILLRLDDAVFTAVSALEQTVVVAAKTAARDGQLTKSDGAAVKAAALAEIKSHLGPKGIAELQAILGVQPDGLDSFISSRIEASVLQMPVVTQVPEAPQQDAVRVQTVRAPDPGSVTTPVSASEAETPALPRSTPRFPSRGAVRLPLWAAVGIIAGLLCLLAAFARADTPTSPQLGGCVASGAVCFGTAADVVLTKVGLSSSNKGISGGFSTGVGYGVTVAPDKFYATGLDLFLNVNLSGSAGLASRVSPALMLHMMNYLFLGVVMDITAPTDVSTSYGTGWSLLLGFGSTITSITPGYAKVEAARQMAAAKAAQEPAKAAQP